MIAQSILPANGPQAQSLIAATLAKREADKQARTAAELRVRDSLAGRAEPLLSERIATALSTADVLPVSVSLALPKELQAVALIACASVLIGYIRAGWNVMSVSRQGVTGQGAELFVRFDVPVVGKDASSTSDEVLRALGDLSRS
jgi:hypothetical protein